MATPLKARRFLLFALWFAQVSLSFAGDEQWSREFFPASDIYSRINAMVTTPDGRLVYAGNGPLTTADPMGGGVIVMRKGEMTIPLATYGANVYALAVDGDTVYAGGDFTTLSGYAVTNLARWDGHRWSQFGGGVSGGPVRALAMHNGALYIGGGFTNIGGQISAGGIARWDGTNLTSLGTAHPFVSYLPAVRALQFVGDSLYVAGLFDSVNGVAVTNIAEYVNGSWRALGNGLSRTYASYGYAVSMSANSAGQLYVVGLFDTAGDVPARNIAKWDGLNWSALAEGIDLNSSLIINAVHCFGADVYVAGGIYYPSTNGSRAVGSALWDGQQWVGPIPNAPILEATAFASDATNL